MRKRRNLWVLGIVIGVVLLLIGTGTYITIRNADTDDNQSQVSDDKDLDKEIDKAADKAIKNDTASNKAESQSRVVAEGDSSRQAESESRTNAELESQNASASAETEASSKKAKAAEDEKNKYNSGITYDQLARNPEQNEGEYVKFTGKVLQVQEDGNDTTLRVAIDGDYDHVIMVTYNLLFTPDSHILEDDKITFYGQSKGRTTYEATSGRNITVPLVDADKIDDSGTAPDDYGY
ncbi:transcriptional regulator [Lacticaseibacillus paracasei]|uniref:transcriptional regulator n=1 Tax=Lacticaseibacillus paracasei TaxID=1597 RepID=UPI001E3900FB|nr:transcriptional regulator [Lacticaseibacillus paracasei]